MDTVKAGSERSESIEVGDERSRSNRHGWGEKYCHCHPRMGDSEAELLVNGRWVVVDNMMTGLLHPVNVADGRAQAAGGALSRSQDAMASNMARTSTEALK